MTVDVQIVPTIDKKKSKDKKRKRAEEAAIVGVEPVSEEPKEKKRKDSEDKPKKRKRDVESSSEQPPSDEKEKKKKKKKKASSDEDAMSAEAAESASVESVDAPIEKKKKKKKSKTVDAEAATVVAEVVPTTSSSSAISSYLAQHSVTITVPDGTLDITPALAFSDLSLPASLRSAFTGFSAPTPIQACAWPAALAGRDVVGIAETGSGKTLAFGIPALSRLLLASSDKKGKKGKGPAPTIRVLVVAPTRELALQTHDNLVAIGKPLGIGSVAVFGGVDKRAQVELLRGREVDGVTTRIVVGTPGRIIDLVNDGACDLSGVDYLVLDEADRMLDKGFENDIRKIISYTIQGEGRQTLMFSATWPESVRRLAASFQRNPVRVTVGSDDLTANSRVEQSLHVFDDPRSKDSRLLEQLQQLKHPKKPRTGSENARILVFALYKKEASRVEGMLKTKGYSVEAIHGDMSQTARIAALQAFKDGTTNTLVATDVAARGLDIPDVAVVLNYSFPLTIEDYIHRIGRTGRGGKSGKSITFFTGENHERALAGELARVLSDSGFDSPELRERFPMTIKKKTHSVYGAFFRDDIPAPKAPTKIKF